MESARSNDSEERKMDDLEKRHVQRGIYMSTPPKTYARLP